MPDANVYFALTGDTLSYFKPHSFHVSLDDAQQCLDLIDSGSDDEEVDVLSANCKMRLLPDDRIGFYSDTHQDIEVDRRLARRAISEGLDEAERVILDDKAHRKLWDWTCKEHPQFELPKLNDGDRLTGTLLRKDRDFLVLQTPDGQVWFAKVDQVFGLLVMSESVTINRSGALLHARPARR
jgi:hypothetical protein